MLLTTVFQVWAPWIVRQAVDHLERGTPRGLLLRDAGLILLVVAMQGVFLFTMRMTLIRASRRMEYELRNDLFRHMARLPASTYRRHKVGDYLSRATNDLDAVRNFLGPGLMYLANTLVTFVMSVALMCRIDVRLTLISLLPLPVLSFTVARLGARLHRYYEAIQASFANLTAKAQETLAGIRVVKAHVEEEGEYQAFLTLHEDYLEKNRSMIRIWATMGPTLSLVGGLAAAVILWVGGTAVVQGRISLGSLIAFQIYLAMLIWPMVALGWVSNLFQRGAASMARIQAVLDEPIETDVDPPAEVRPRAAKSGEGVAASGDGATGNGLPSADATIRLHEVAFRYPYTDHWVLENVSLEVRPGERVALVGRTGAGKSTILHLIARLYEPTRGEVRLGGIPVRDWPRRALRRRLGIVPQETFLFSDTIRANISFGVEDGAPAPDVEAAARRAGLGPDLPQLPQGLETMIGERGITLSGGQKQRVALARALSLDRPVLLLDDCFASVDPGTEEEILGELFRLPGRPSILLATHRRSALLRVDRIVVLDGGRVVATGTHEELLEAGGLYADLYHREEVEEELEAL